MKKTILCISTVLAVIIVLYGCKVSPFSPKADVRINYFTDVSNATLTGLSVTGSPPHTIKANISVLNAVDVNFNQYVVEYYDAGDNQLPIKISNKTSFYVSTTSTSITAVTGSMPIAVTNADIIQYKTDNSIKQMLLKIYIYGEDVNGNAVDCRGQINAYF